LGSDIKNPNPYDFLAALKWQDINTNLHGFRVVKGKNKVCIF
jgi:hypothetical protein